ncbi:MAG TPA: thiamine phosphate synthase [Candidatus Acidoferrales bacterium]|nr:thiamine phosphate synthase [Candidatus Acidoferrales bacterium]
MTDRSGFSGVEAREAQETLLLRMETAAAAGVDWVQIREKDLSGRDCGLLTREALQRAAKSPASNASPTRILVNDRLDVALSEGAGGVHLGENSLPLPEAKRLVKAQALSRDFLIGVSCHSLDAARSAASGGADYLFFGPIFSTPSKAAFGAPQGLERFAEVCRAVSIPVLAIGGITLANASACLAAGASGIAAIRLFQDARDMSSLVQSLRKLTP